MMLSYVCFGTNDFERAIRFYEAVLAPLGMPRCVTGDRSGIVLRPGGQREHGCIQRTLVESG
jgi:catechol 2,3-dioxygenase-like lactoylglutathione lyase family enzyme